MIKDDIFVLNDVNADNIDKISQKQSLLEEQRLCEISEIANEAVSYAMNMRKDGYGIYELLSLLTEAFVIPAKKIHTSVLDDNFESLVYYLQIISAYDKIIFTKLFVDKIKESGFQIYESDFLPVSLGGETFTYVKNPLADEAYDVFSQDFINPRLKYSQNLTEAVKSVAGGEIEYALLPFEERGGARLASVAALIFREELKINSVTPVFGYEGSADMKYALVSKNFSVPDFESDDDRYLEIRLRADSSILLSELFTAANTLGCSIYRVNTYSFDTEDGPTQYYSIVFRGDEAKDFSRFLVYLTLFSGAYTPVGIYKNLE